MLVFFINPIGASGVHPGCIDFKPGDQPIHNTVLVFFINPIGTAGIDPGLKPGDLLRDSEGPRWYLSFFDTRLVLGT